MSSSVVNPAVQDMFTEAGSIIHRFGDQQPYVSKEKYMGNVEEVAGLLEMSRQKHAERMMDPAQHFDNAVAHALIREVAESVEKPGKDCILAGLVELAFKILYSARVPNPAATMSLGSLISAAESKLLSVRSQLVGWLRECDGLGPAERRKRLEESEKWNTLSAYIVIVSFMSLLCSRLGESRSWRQTDDLKTLSRAGFRIVCDYMRLDQDRMLPAEWRSLLMRTILTWLDISKDDFLVELLAEPALGQMEICVWRDRFDDFFHHFPAIFDGDLDFNFADQVNEITFWAEFVEFRRTTDLVGMHVEG
ncbi:hypothetical protein KVR01_013509 [Diaporthe batatas]|uniref:uncharacterized protein n=1 Tax=Diaporthe batatas TaxID=748121 RepID=UPI001D03A721|nr:uncharacterized protein KVR01_013509 [Diaporthe batatas]KAG8156558.1 hypothetical protein KVR01_013509 [Diaporthe batatas]